MTSHNLLTLLPLLSLLLASCAHVETKWYPWNIHAGCVNWSEVHDAYPVTRYAKTPEEIIKIVKNNIEYESGPYINLLREFKRTSDDPEEIEQINWALETFTTENSYYFKGVSERFDLLVFTEELCNKLNSKEHKL